MGSVQPVGFTGVDLAGNPHWELVLRTVGSPVFRKSARLRDFLLYVGEAAIRGKTEEVTEHHIGCAVFGRRPTYSPADDNIVRVHARQLRFRLEEHFRGDGRAEPVIIEIPKGSYAPVFLPRPVVAEVTPEVVPVAGGAPLPVPEPRRIRAVLAACAVLILICSVLAYQNWRFRQGDAASRSLGRAPALLAAVCDTNRTTTVVVPDSGFGTLQAILGKRLSLEDYLNPAYPEGMANPSIGEREQQWLRGIARRPYTTFAILLAAARLSRLAERYHWNLTFSFAKDVRVRDLNDGNVILLGSAMSNPWVSLYEKELTFRSGWDESLRVPHFQNADPRPGEQSVYPASERNGVPGASYGVVSLVVDSKAGANRDSRVLILEGVNMEGTEAAVDFVCDAERTAELLHLRPGEPTIAGQNYRMEVLLRTKAMAGAARGTEVVATRNTRPR